MVKWVVRNNVKLSNIHTRNGVLYRDLRKRILHYMVELGYKIVHKSFIADPIFFSLFMFFWICTEMNPVVLVLVHSPF